MKLPDDCPFAKTPLQQFPETEMHRINCCRAGADVYLTGTDEPPLCRSRRIEPEAYRFIWRSSFDGDAVVHIAREGNSVGLRSCLLRSRLRLWVPLPSVVLSLDDWGQLQRALTSSGLWALDAADEQFGLDGARWFIEGRRDDVYRWVERWSPRGAVHNLGRLFFALAGPPLASVELY